MIAEMMNTRTRLGETPLHAQVNAGHADTFRPIYNHTSLKAKNEAANMRLTRLQGADESIVAQNKAIYCEEIVHLGSANGRTLLQAAQDQVPYNPSMQLVAQEIKREIPCLADL